MQTVQKLRKPFFLFALMGSIPKRLRFVISAISMSVFMLISTIYFNNVTEDWYIIPLLIVVSYFLTYFSVLEGVEKGEFLTLFIMPVLFTIAAYMFYLLVPGRWLTRLPFIIIYGFSFYAILLISNIFNVGVEKNLQLYRAAFSVNYLYQSVVVFLFLQVILSFRLNFIINACLSFVVIFPLSLQILWSVKPIVYIPKHLFLESLFISILILEAVVLVSFIPFRPPIVALFITACFYSLCGLVYHKLDERLFRKTINEYVFVLIFVTIVCLLTLRW